MARVVHWITNGDDNTGSIYVSGGDSDPSRCLDAIQQERLRHRKMGLSDPLAKYAGMRVTAISFESDKPLLCLLIERLLNAAND